MKGPYFMRTTTVLENVMFEINKNFQLLKLQIH
jgi:hypothetical protein